MLTVRLPVELDQRLRRLAKETDRTKAFYVRKALETMLDEFERRYLGETHSPVLRLEDEQARLYVLAEAQRMAAEQKESSIPPEPPVLPSPTPKAFEKSSLSPATNPSAPPKKAKEVSPKGQSAATKKSAIAKESVDTEPSVAVSPSDDMKQHIDMKRSAAAMQANDGEKALDTKNSSVTVQPDDAKKSDNTKRSDSKESSNSSAQTSLFDSLGF